MTIVNLTYPWNKLEQNRSRVRTKVPASLKESSLKVHDVEQNTSPLDESALPPIKSCPSTAKTAATNNNKEAREGVGNADIVVTFVLVQFVCATILLHLVLHLPTSIGSPLTVSQLSSCRPTIITVAAIHQARCPQ